MKEPYISNFGGKSVCKGCGKDEELRLGYCFDCATSGEERAAKRSVEEHLRNGLKNLKEGKNENGRYDFEWALERLTLTGHYADGGIFDQEGYKWRKPTSPDVNDHSVGVNKMIEALERIIDRCEQDETNFKIRDGGPVVVTLLIAKQALAEHGRKV